MRWSVQGKENNAKTDEQLAAAAQGGDASATETLLYRYKNAVRARARGFFLAGGETDDLIQEGMVGLYAAIGDYRPESGKSFKNFAYLCVTRRILDAVKGSSRQKNVPLNNYVSIFDPDFDDKSGDESPEDTLITTESRAEFWVKIGKALSDFEFRVTLLWLYGESYREIAEATNKPLKSVDNALARARKKLQAALTDGKK